MSLKWRGFVCVGAKLPHASSRLTQDIQLREWSDICWGFLWPAEAEISSFHRATQTRRGYKTRATYSAKPLEDSVAQSLVTARLESTFRPHARNDSPADFSLLLIGNRSLVCDVNHTLQIHYVVNVRLIQSSPLGLKGAKSVLDLPPCE